MGGRAVFVALATPCTGLNHQEYCQTLNICGRKILWFFYFELFAGGKFCTFLRPS